MMIEQNLNFYDILEIDPEASAQEVREAYLRIKSTYNRDHMALYTLISTLEREEILKKAEEAYLVLSNQEKREVYDQNHGLLSLNENPFNKRDPKTEGRKDTETEPQRELAEVVSIDRVPPMENLPDSDQALIPPSTDFAFSSNEKQFQQSPGNSKIQRGLIAPKEKDISNLTPSHSTSKNKNPPSAPAIDPVILSEIETQTEWTGAAIQKMRVLSKISIEEMSEVTKISKTYILAIEEENFAKLPAKVYIRGFVMQIARTLKLPSEKVAGSYLLRYQQKLTK